MSAASSNSTSAPRLSPGTCPRRHPWARARRPASASARPFCSLTGNSSPSRSCAFIPSVCHGRDRRHAGDRLAAAEGAHAPALAVGAVGHLAALLVEQRRPGPAQEGVAGGVVPGRGPVERDRRRRLSRRHQREAVRDARHRPEPGRGDAGEVARRVRVPRARHEDDVPLESASGRRGRDRPTVARQRPAALGPGEEVALVVRVREGEDDAEARHLAQQQADRDRAAPSALEVVAGPVVRVHDPDRIARRPRDGARLLAEEPPAREGLEQPAADQPLGLGVGVGLVHLAPRPAGAVEVGAQEVAGLAGREQTPASSAARRSIAMATGF